MSYLLNKIKDGFKEPIPKFGAVILIVGGLIVGTFCTIGMHYWQGSVSKDEAIFTKATFESYTEEHSGKTTYFELHFKDYERLDIRHVCCSDEVREYVHSLKPGTILQLYIHPRSDLILELIDNGNVIIDYDEALKKLSSETRSFMIFGLILYSWAAMGILKIIRKEVI